MLNQSLSVQSENTSSEGMGFVEWITWFGKEASVYKTQINWFMICFALLGISLNGIVIDVASKIRNQTSGNKWMKLLAFWDTAFLTIITLEEFLFETFGIGLDDINVISCKMHPYARFWSTANASAHLVMMAIDRALSITFPTWHYNRNWNKLVPIISVSITFFYAIGILPTLWANQIRGGVCIVSIDEFLQVYRVVYVISFFVGAHFALLLLANITFIYQLRKRRTPKVKKPTQQKVTSETKQRVTERCEIEMSSKSKKVPNTKTEEDSEESLNDLSSTLVDFIYCGPSSLFPTNYSSKNEPGNIADAKVKSFLIPETDILSLVGSSGSSSDRSNEDMRVQEQSGIVKIFTENNDPVINMGTELSSIRPKNRSKSGATQEKTNDEEKAENINKLEPQLTPEDLKAVRTVLYICLCYFVCMFPAIVFFIAQRKSREFEVEKEASQLLGQLSQLLIMLNSTFNFFFYLRGNSFRSTFKSRYMF